MALDKDTLISRFNEHFSKSGSIVIDTNIHGDISRISIKLPWFSCELTEIKHTTDVYCKLLDHIYNFTKQLEVNNNHLKHSLILPSFNMRVASNSNIDNEQFMEFVEYLENFSLINTELLDRSLNIYKQCQYKIGRIHNEIHDVIFTLPSETNRFITCNVVTNIKSHPRIMVNDYVSTADIDRWLEYYKFIYLAIKKIGQLCIFPTDGYTISYTDTTLQELDKNCKFLGIIIGKRGPASYEQSNIHLDLNNMTIISSYAPFTKVQKYDNMAINNVNMEKILPPIVDMIKIRDSIDPNMSDFFYNFTSKLNTTDEVHQALQYYSELVNLEILTGSLHILVTLAPHITKKLYIDTNMHIQMRLKYLPDIGIEATFMINIMTVSGHVGNIQKIYSSIDALCADIVIPKKNILNFF